MSCGLSKELLALADKIDGAKAEIEGKISELQNGAIGGIKSIIDAQVADLKNELKAALPEIEIPTKIQNLQKDIESFAGKILTAKLAGEDLIAELETIKAKWGGLDLGSISINDIPRLLRSGALDLDNICQLIPNYELDGAEITLRGTPITFPNINVENLIRGGPLPKLTKPDFTVQVNRRVKNATNKFLNISLPGLYEG